MSTAKLLYLPGVLAVCVLAVMAFGWWGVAALVVLGAGWGAAVWGERRSRRLGMKDRREAEERARRTW